MAIRLVPVDMTKLHFTAWSVIPKESDGIQQVDNEGTPKWTVNTVMNNNGTPETVRVTVTSKQAPDVQPMNQVIFTDLFVGAYESGGRAAFYFQAQAAHTPRSK